MSDNAGVVIIKEGYLHKAKSKKKNAWNQRWYILTGGGALVYYRKKTNLNPAGVAELHAFDIKDTPPSDMKLEKDKHAFVLTHRASSKQTILSAQSALERDEWISLIKPHTSKDVPPSSNTSSPSPSSSSIPLPQNPHASNKSTAYKMQANVASSAIGRKLIKEIVDEDSWKTLDALTRFLKAVKGEETALKFRKDLVSIGTKIALLHKHNMLPDSALPQMVKAVRLLSQAVVDYYQMPSIFDAPTLITFIDGLRKATEPHLENKVTPKTLQKYRDLFDAACDETLLDDLFSPHKWAELGEIVALIRKNLTIR